MYELPITTSQAAKLEANEARMTAILQAKAFVRLMMEHTDPVVCNAVGLIWEVFKGTAASELQELAAQPTKAETHHVTVRENKQGGHSSKNMGGAGLVRLSGLSLRAAGHPVNVEVDGDLPKQITKDKGVDVQAGTVVVCGLDTYCISISEYVAPE